MPVVMPIILVMISMTHNASSIYDGTFFVVNALILPSVVIGDGIFDKQRLLSV
jgi:hypothetical protein